jgi:acyl-coenzyme A thioesterase PaaI-like protein
VYSVAEMLGGLLALTTFDFEGELAGFVPLVKESTIRFRRPALGVVRASASLPDDEITRVRREAMATGKGEFVLEATLTDEQGEVVASTVGTYQVRRFG